MVHILNSRALERRADDLVDYVKFTIKTHEQGPRLARAADLYAKAGRRADSPFDQVRLLKRAHDLRCLLRDANDDVLQGISERNAPEVARTVAAHQREADKIKSILETKFGMTVGNTSSISLEAFVPPPSRPRGPAERLFLF